MSFQRSPLRDRPELVASYCLLCGELVAASPNIEILAIIEQLHECSPIWKPQP